MKDKRMLYIIVGLVIATIVVYFLYQSVQEKIGKAVKNVATAKVIGGVADRAIGLARPVR